MKKSRLLAAVGYLVLGMWLGSSSLDEATAQSPSLTFPLKLAQTQPPSPSNTPHPDANLEARESKSFVTPPPISPACPFPPIPVSETVTNVTFGELSFEIGESTVVTFEPGDGSDADLSMTISNLVGEGKLDEALQVAQKIKDVSQKNEALQRIASAYQETGQLEQALEVAKGIAEAPQTNDTLLDDTISVKDNVLSEIAAAYVDSGQLEQALEVVELMGGEGFRVNTLLNIAEKYRVEGQLEHAASVIERAVADYRTAARADSTDPVLAGYIKLLVLARFANQYLAVGQTEQAVKLSSEMFEVAKTLPQQNYMTLTVLLSAAEVFALAGQQEKAADEVLSYSLEAANSIQETFVKALLLAQAAAAYAKLKQPDHASELLSQALELTESEQGVSEKNLVRVAIARSYWVLGQFDEAFQITNTIEPTSLRYQVKQTLDCSRKAG